MAKIGCLCCGGTAESTHRHHATFVTDCPNRSMVDGGGDYLRLGGIDLEKIVLLADAPEPVHAIPEWAWDSRHAYADQLRALIPRRIP